MTKLNLTAEEKLLNIWPGNQIRKHFKEIKTVQTLPTESFKDYQNNDFLLSTHKGSFLKPCPATKNYNCCDLWIFHFAQGCNINCHYCILEAYLGSASLVVFGNLNKGLNDLEILLKKNPLERPQRFCTGEFTDSLLFDHLSGLAEKMVSIFSNSHQALLELKTKTDNIESLLGLKHRGKTVVSFSVNAPNICHSEEKLAAPLENRLKAAQKLAAEGYPIGLHFDPLIYHDNWQKNYQETIDLIDYYLKKATLAWVSMGCFRFLPKLKEISLNKYPKSNIFNPEFILAPDGKMRYPRHIRSKMYEFIKKQLEIIFPKITLYMCMESPQIWQEVFSFDPQTNGLKQILDNQVKKLTAKTFS